MSLTKVNVTCLTVKSTSKSDFLGKNLSDNTQCPVRLRQKIEEFAELRGWSVRQIALEAGISQQTLHGALEGADISVSRAIKIARVIDVPVEWLFDDAQDLKSLTRRPFWMPPGIEVGRAAAVQREALAELDRYVREQHGIEDEPTSVQPSRPARAADAGADTGKRRKRRAAGG